MKSKQLSEHDNPFAKGGKTRMFGTGDRTRAATSDAAGRQTKGQTSSKSATNPKFAGGGKTRVGFSPAEPAKAGRTAPGGRVK